MATTLEYITPCISAGCQFVVMEAAVLLEAGWDGMVHEVWVAIIPQQEVMKGR